MIPINYTIALMTSRIQDYYNFLVPELVPKKNCLQKEILEPVLEKFGIAKKYCNRYQKKWY